MPALVIPIHLSVSNAYLVLGDRPVLVDAGAPKDGDRLRDALRAEGVAPGDLSLIALTHGHTDHTGALAAVAGDGAPVAVGAQDVAMVEAGVNGPLPPTGAAGRLLLPMVRRTTFAGWRAELPLTGALRLDDYGVGGELVPVGGHTAGSYVVFLDDGDAMVGDMVRGGFASGRVRPGHPLRHFYTEDRAANRTALEQVLARDPRRILVGHGGPLHPADVRRRLDNVT